MSGEIAPPPEQLLAKLEELTHAQEALDAREPARPTEAPQTVIVVPEVAPPPAPPPTTRKRAVLYSSARRGFMRSTKEEFSSEREELRRELDASPLAPTSTSGAGEEPATTRGDALRRLGLRSKAKP